MVKKVNFLKLFFLRYLLNSIESNYSISKSRNSTIADIRCVSKSYSYCYSECFGLNKQNFFFTFLLLVSNFGDLPINSHKLLTIFKEKSIIIKYVKYYKRYYLAFVHPSGLAFVHPSGL